jgi:hypothetical protein
MGNFPVNEPSPCRSGLKYKKCHGHPVAEKRPSTPLLAYEPIKLVRQEAVKGAGLQRVKLPPGRWHRRGGFRLGGTCDKVLTVSVS